MKMHSFTSFANDRSAVSKPLSISPYSESLHSEFIFLLDPNDIDDKLLMKFSLIDERFAQDGVSGVFGEGVLTSLVVITTTELLSLAVSYA